MVRRALWVVAGLAVVLTALGLAQVPSPQGVTLKPDLPFATGGGEALQLDLAMPAGDGPFPAVVCLHGGGWVGGDRKQMAQTLEVLARRGFVAVAPDYRLAPKHPFPAQVEDCKAAVRWLRAHAKAYKVDPRRVGAVGLSAGGHLACLLGVTDRADGLEGSGGHPEESSRVQAVVSFCGPTDLTAPVWGREVREKNLLPLLGGTADEKPEAYRRASPVTYAGKEAPPLLFLHGSADPVVPPAQSQALADKVQAAGGSARVVAFDGEGHGLRGQALLKAIDEMLTFFDETLKK